MLPAEVQKSTADLHKFGPVGWWGLSRRRYCDARRRAEGVDIIFWSFHMNDKSLSMILGGGGARGMAHIGVI